MAGNDRVRNAHKHPGPIRNNHPDLLEGGLCLRAHLEVCHDAHVHSRWPPGLLLHYSLPQTIPRPPDQTGNLKTHHIRRPANHTLSVQALYLFDVDGR